LDIGQEVNAFWKYPLIVIQKLATPKKEEQAAENCVAELLGLMCLDEKVKLLFFSHRVFNEGLRDVNLRT
jgi:hypothetical protein